MNNNKTNFFFLILFLISFNSLAQAPKSFSSEPEVFFKELKGYMELTNKNETEKLMDKFELMWIKTPKFTGEQMRTIVGTANDMLKKRMKPYPDFSNYVIALMAFSESGRNLDMFLNWHNSLDKVISGSTKRYSNYIEDVAGLFASNTLYESSSTKWVASTGDFLFEFDTVPRIKFPKMDLTCYAKEDSSVISGVSGYYYPLSKTFVGKGGKLFWTRAGLNATTTYADILSVTVDLTSTEWGTDSAVFYSKQYFKEPLRGKVLDKILANVTPEKATYPRFNSYDLKLGIKEIVKDADYVGGFSQHGSKMIGSGTKEQKATLTFKRNNKLFLVVSSMSFVVRPDRISSDNAAMVCFYEQDSIYHPSVEMKYISKDRELSFIRTSGVGVSMPFFNSFHQMDMYVDAIYWKIDDPIMELKMLSGQGESKMVLESSNLYTDERYQKIQGISDVSPLYTIKQYVEKTSRIIYVPDFARHLRVSEQQARSLIIYLANKGFLSYDFETDESTINEKLYYYLAARSNKTDYDKIEIESVISALPNAKLNLMNFEMDLQGVGRILLSDSQQVWIAPVEQQMRLLKNRDFEFSGRVHAGRSDFFGKKFKFLYDQFRIDLANVDSIRLKVVSETELDENGNPKLIPLKSTLQNVAGKIYIDSLTNKSSRKSYPAYPIFVSDKEAFVYYDHPSIYNSVYKRDNFYFKMDPFTIDSLDNFSAGGLKFKGDFESGGIFPTIAETAIIRPDYSFGFERESPSDGYAMYGGKGRYFNHIDLSYAGLIGDGKVEYLSSTSESKDIVFFPDSTNMDKTAWDLRKETIAGVGFPQANGSDTYVNWRPKEDKMYVFKKSSKLEIYDKNVTVDGNLVLASKGLGGNGDSYFLESELYSKDFWFKQDAYGADTSDFKLKSDDANVLAIQTKNVKSKIDLVKRFGDFISNGKGSFVSFPLNQYICFIAQFKWFIDKQEVEFGDDYKDNTKLNIEGSDFVSINPYQDSLRWNAGLARYSLIDYLIKARKVKEILVADASIQPNDTTTIVIERNAVMRPLLNAKIVANTTTKLHHINEADVNILGRKKYTATGKYAYTDPAGAKHLIALEQIGIDTSLQTYANGTIPDSAQFMLSSNIQYKGGVYIAAANPLLNFDGFAKVNHLCEEKLPANWFSFRSDIDPKGVTIPINEPKNENGEKLSLAISHASDSTGFYASFISPKQRSTDVDLIAATGVLSYDTKAKVYKVASPEKIISPDAPGNMVMLNDANCIVYGEGRLNLASAFGQFVMTVIGNVKNNTNNDSTNFDVLIGLDFMFNNDALKSMSDLITGNPTLKPTDDTRTTWVRGMKELVGIEKADKMISEYSLYGAPKKIPQELQQTIFLSDVKMYWDMQAQAFRSSGPIGIGFIGKDAISRQVKGYFEIQRKRGNDVFNLYLESDNASWWYFNYSRGIMQSISSDNKFNDAINNLKPEKRVASAKGDTPTYEYMLSTDRKKAEFIKKFLGQ
ncbi:MAG: hypothetical protein IPO63_07175 [Bacteroidetes bacterium]|nr:hypothetical protein [Bacteroidota bacterium]